MTWKMSRKATHGLLALLQRRNFKLILLWLDEIDGHPNKQSTSMEVRRLTNSFASPSEQLVDGAEWRFLVAC